MSCTQHIQHSKVPQLVVSRMRLSEQNCGNKLTFRTLATIFGVESLRVIVYNMLIGNQIIVRGDNITVADILVGLLSLILPTACSTPLVHAASYRAAWEATLLSVPLECILPSYLASDSFALVEFHPQPNLLSEYTWNVQGVSQPTTLGFAIEGILNNEKESYEDNIILLVEEWLAKAKAYARLRTMVEAHNDRRLQEFSHALGLLHKADFSVLAFWTTGLRQFLKSSTHIYTMEVAVI